MIGGMRVRKGAIGDLFRNGIWQQLRVLKKKKKETLSQGREKSYRQTQCEFYCSSHRQRQIKKPCPMFLCVCVCVSVQWSMFVFSVDVCVCVIVKNRRSK